MTYFDASKPSICLHFPRKQSLENYLGMPHLSTKSMRKGHWISLCLAFAVAAFFALLEQQRDVHFLRPRIHSGPSDAVQGKKSGFLLGRMMQRAEWSTSDARFKLRGPRPANPDIVIVAIDEKSLHEMQEWPWPRSIHAKLIEILQASAPKALLFDVLFLEPFTANLAGDKALARATENSPWTVHSLFLNVRGSEIAGGRIPISELVDASHHVGSVNAFVDEDGVLRSALLQINVDDQPVPLLSLVGAGLYLGRSSEEVLQHVPLDKRGELLVNYVGSDHSFPYISYVDVLKGKVPADTFKGKMVLVGSNATGTYDHYPTPLSSVMPGVEFHANVMDNLVAGTSLRFAGMRTTYAAIAIFALLVGVVLSRFSAGMGALAAFVLMSLYGFAAQWLFKEKHLVIDVAGPMLTLGLGYLALVVYRFFTEEREKRWVKAAFGQYVSPKVLDVLMEDPSKLKLVGERREMTVFFSDVAGFTSISERMNPDELVVLLNKYLSAMTEVVFKYDGYLNKYMGDGIMAFWNAPVKQSDHVARACLCALDSMKRLDELNKELAVLKIPELKARIGLNSGDMIVGNMGSIQKSDYTVMGDNVNLGSRLEGANKAFGSSIMISEFTEVLIHDQFEVRFLDRIRVPGKAKPVKTYELLGVKGSLGGPWPEALPLYHEGIQLFADRQFEESRIKFLAVLKIMGHDKPSETYLERIQAFAAVPPAKEWDGVFDLKTK